MLQLPRLWNWYKHWDSTFRFISSLSAQLHPIQSWALIFESSLNHTANTHIVKHTATVCSHTGLFQTSLCVWIYNVITLRVLRHTASVALAVFLTISLKKSQELNVKTIKDYRILISQKGWGEELHHKKIKINRIKFAWVLHLIQLSSAQKHLIWGQRKGTPSISFLITICFPSIYQADGACCVAQGRYWWTAADW